MKVIHEKGRMEITLYCKDMTRDAQELLRCGYLVPIRACRGWFRDYTLTDFDRAFKIYFDDGLGPILINGKSKEK